MLSNEQARTDVTPWRCLNVGVLFDLPVDAACTVIGFLVSTMGELFFFLPFHSSAQIAPILHMKAPGKQLTHSLSLHSIVAR
jgi:hypothetical protein